MEQEEESKTIMLRGLSLHVTEDDVSSQFSFSLTHTFKVKVTLNIAR